MLAAVLSDGTLVTLAAAMLAVLVKPRLFPRPRPAPAGAAAELGATVLCLVDPSGAVRFVTPNAARILGASCDEAAALGLSLNELIQAVAAEPLGAWLDSVWLTSAPGPLVLFTRGGLDNSRWLELTAAGRTRLAEREVAVIEVRDATSRAERDRRLSLLSGAMRAAAEAIYVTDAEGRIEHVNGAFERISGLREDAVAGQPASVLSSGRHRHDFFAKMWETLRDGGHYTGEVTNRRPDGTCYTLDLSITSVRDADDQLHYVAVGRDVTQRKQLEHDIEDLAFYDPLTGLARMRLLRERSEQILALARRHGRLAALVQVDIDGMRALNAAHGRSVGDDVLRTVADRLRLDLRDSDTLARGAGDAFLVLLSELTDEAALGRVVRRLHERVIQPCHIGPRAIEISARLGVAVYPQDASNFDELLEQTDTAHRRAVQVDAPFEFYSRDLTHANRDRLALEEDLDWAWDHDHFALHYQPIIATDGRVVGAEALARGAVAGLEALARWRHLDRGMLLPEHFVPLLERTGRMRAFDQWAILGATRQAADWLARGWSGWVSVNLSARSLHDPELPAFVARALAEQQLSGNRLMVEISEAAALSDPRATATAIDALREVGVRVALDDFGVGQSSLTCLKLFTVDVLKLDCSFSADIGRGDRHEQLLLAMIGVAHRIGARVVAAGVDNEDQFEWLRAAGCDLVQGHLIGSPAPPEALPHMPQLPVA